jgi:hypothetical protein
MEKKVVAIVGSYRKKGIIDSIIDEILSSASKQGAKTQKIYLIDKHIEFCTNCRTCTQSIGTQRGKCIINDDMETILSEIENADALVIGSPVNYYNVTAITRKFMERLTGFAYWPWDKRGQPTFRIKEKRKKAILVISSALPSFLVGILSGAPRALKIIAETLGTKPVQTITIGMMGVSKDQSPPESAVRKAKEAGIKLLA